MRVMAHTDRLHVLVDVDGRHRPETQWATIEERATREFPGCTVHGAYVITGDPNVRPYRKRGERL